MSGYRAEPENTPPGAGARSAPFVWAHRGASGRAPENTLAAFRLAEAAGADGIELDVHLSRDGVPVVIHDETVDRTSDGSGAVAELTLAQLRRLDVGSWYAPEFRGEPLPTLAEVLDWAGDRLRLNIEIKSGDAGQAVCDLLADYPQARVLVSSFRHDLLLRLRRRSSQLPLAFLTDSPFWRIAMARAVACRAEALHPPERGVTRLLVAACHRRKIAVAPWTVDAPDRKRQLARFGVDGLFTNLP